MQDYLILYLHAEHIERPSWVVVDAAAVVQHSVYQGDAAALAQVAIDKHITVIVPAEDVLLTHAKLPNMRRQRLMQALPYSLEEQLVDDVEALHFAIGPYQADSYFPVAIVAHEKMQQWLSLMSAWHIQADVMIPLTLALPLPENGYVAWAQASGDVANQQAMTIIRTGLFEGYACDTHNLATFLNLSLSHAKQLPTKLELYNYTQQALTETLYLPIQLIETQLAPEQSILEVACTVRSSTAINLLQGRFTVKKSKLPQVTKVWQWTMYAAMAWVFLLFFYPTVSYFILRHKVNSIDDGIAAIYQRQFPQASSVVAPRLRLEEKLHKLTGQAGENHLLLLLAYVGQGISANQNLILQRLDYQNNQLTLSFSAASAEEFSAFTDFLTQHGLSVKQQNANVAGTRVNATLLVE